MGICTVFMEYKHFWISGRCEAGVTQGGCDQVLGSVVPDSPAQNQWIASMCFLGSDAGCAAAENGRTDQAVEDSLHVGFILYIRFIDLDLRICDIQIGRVFL